VSDVRELPFDQYQRYRLVADLFGDRGDGGRPLHVLDVGGGTGLLRRFLPEAPRARYLTLQWLMWQMGGLGPMLGQAHHFRQYAPEQIPYAVERYTNEARRLYGVADRRLGETRFLAGDDYTIADIASFPWTRSHERQGVDFADYPNVKRWFGEIAARPAVQRGLEVLADRRATGKLDDKARDILFGATQYQRR